MGTIAIKVENLSKSYKIGAAAKQHENIREAITDFLLQPFRRKRGNGDTLATNTIWAIKDVSFEVEKGEVVGIIGRNGAGKSTLLKILSRITPPTEGRAMIKGRVGSLLEVGAGFHPELTGRENIYLSGAILGMTRAEIRRKFDEIVAFSEIEKFIDTPVKHYSSGMYVRLAFSVAAHLDPEVLLVDEVLAVGDAGFQKKCLGRMGTITEGGRTILFVSHNMAAITSLCKKTLLLANGRIVKWGATNEVVDTYLNSFVKPGEQALEEESGRDGNQKFRAVGFWVEDADGERISFVKTGQEVVFKVKISPKCSEKISGVCIVGFRDMEGKKIFEFNNLAIGCKMEFRGDAIVSYRIKKFPLLEDRYTVSIMLAGGAPGYYEVFDWVRDAFQLVVIGGDYHGEGMILERQKAGIFTADFDFEVFQL